MSFSRLLFLVCIALGIVLPIRLFIIDPIVIVSPSMEPLFPVGGHVFMDRVTLRFREPRRGDIIVFASPVGEKHELVKRVIAIPGDAIEMREKKVILNGKELREDYTRYKRKGERLEGDDMEPLTVPKGMLFVLGDNRDESRDSTSWKDPKTGEPIRFIPRKTVRGLVRGFYQ